MRDPYAELQEKICDRDNLTFHSKKRKQIVECILETDARAVFRGTHQH